MQSDTLDFWNNYELLSSSISYSPKAVKSNVCRYCNKTNGQTTFTQKTHLLPEFLGRNNVYTYDECDGCNNLFSDYESHLSIFVRPHLTFLGIKGKRKIAAFQSRTVDRNEEARTSLKYGENHKRILQFQGSNDFSIDTEKKVLDINFRKPPYIPLKVYKSILKIALSLLPIESDESNKAIFDWLRNIEGNVHYIPYVFMTSLKKKFFPKPSADLFKVKKVVSDEDIFPEYILILRFSNQVVQMVLPYSQNFKEIIQSLPPTIALFPAFIYDKDQDPESANMRCYDLRFASSVYEDEKISVRYDSFWPANDNMK